MSHGLWASSSSPHISVVCDMTFWRHQKLLNKSISQKKTLDDLTKQTHKLTHRQQQKQQHQQ